MSRRSADPVDPGTAAPAETGELPFGYLWDDARQARELPREHSLHLAILDELEEDDLLEIDLSRASDYVLWAAAQALAESERRDEALALLHRLAGSASHHPALCYPEILVRLGEMLRDRGDYDEALGVLERAERDDPALGKVCLERRAEVMVLSGRREAGLRLFEAVATGSPDDPWGPLTAAWALLQCGEYEAALSWIGRGETAARRLEDAQEEREAAAEIERLRSEARARSERRERTRPTADPEGESRPTTGLEDLKQEILAAIDAEEILLVDRPPRSGEERRKATQRLLALRTRASEAWDEAVERQDDAMIAALDDLQWEVVDLAERFGIDLPGIEDV